MTEGSHTAMPSWMMATATSCQSRPCLLPSRPYWRYSTSRFWGAQRGPADGRVRAAHRKHHEAGKHARSASLSHTQPQQIPAAAHLFGSHRLRRTSQMPSSVLPSVSWSSLYSVTQMSSLMWRLNLCCTRRL